MNELVKTKLVSLLTGSSQVINEEMQNAYGCFMEQVKTIVSQPGTDYSEVFQMLNNTRYRFSYYLETVM